MSIRFMPAPIRSFPVAVAVALLVEIIVVATFLAAGCGRTSLDDGLIPIGGVAGTTGAGAQGGTGTGGRGGTGGQPGSGMNIPCGATTCRAGSQLCCLGGSATLSCVPANDPAACSGVSAACANASNCPASQVCCFSFSTLSTSCTSAALCGISGVTACATSAECPTSAPNCCVVTLGLGGCLPAGRACVPPR